MYGSVVSSKDGLFLAVDEAIAKWKTSFVTMIRGLLKCYFLKGAISKNFGLSNLQKHVVALKLGMVGYFRSIFCYIFL